MKTLISNLNNKAGKNINNQMSTNPMDENTFNPYHHIPHQILEVICTERDVTLTGSTTRKAEQLYEYDKIMPDWIESVSTKTIENFQVLTGTKLYVFAALNNVDVYKMSFMKRNSIIDYIRASMLMDRRSSNYNKYLSVIVGSVDRQIIEILASKLEISNEKIKFITTNDLRKAIITGEINHIDNNVIKNAIER